MLKTSLAILFACVLSAPALPAAQHDRPPAPQPQAVAEIGEGHYCFAIDRGLREEGNPPPVLVLQLRLKLTYRNPAARPLIVPVDHERTIYISPAPGVMKPFHEPLDFFAPRIKTMKALPADVSLDSPVNPANDTFALIPAGGLMRPLEEDVTIPLYKKGKSHQADLRGHRLYLRLRMTHQELSPDLEAVLSDKWARFGVPWTGALLTNTLAIDIPARPQAAECVDK